MSKLGIIFDWDGVIIDSSKQHEASWDRLAEEEHRELPPNHFIQGFGKKNDWIIPEVLKWTEDPAEIKRLSLRKETLYRQIVKERGIAALPGVGEFLAMLHLQKIPWCIGSSTERENIVTILSVLKFETLFGGIVSADDVTLGKPNPEVFLKAAAKIERKPGHCIVFEDAFAGFEAAKNAGMKVTALATTHSGRDLIDKVDRVVNRLDELSYKDLMELAALPKH